MKLKETERNYERRQTRQTKSKTLENNFGH